MPKPNADPTIGSVPDCEIGANTSGAKKLGAFNRSDSFRGQAAGTPPLAAPVDPANVTSASEIEICQPDRKNSRWPPAPHWLRNAENVQSPALKALQSRWKNRFRRSSSRILQRRNAKSCRRKNAEAPCWSWRLRDTKSGVVA